MAGRAGAGAQQDGDRVAVALGEAKGRVAAEIAARRRSGAGFDLDEGIDVLEWGVGDADARPRAGAPDGAGVLYKNTSPRDRG
jgi:hypothetical protein